MGFTGWVRVIVLGSGRYRDVTLRKSSGATYTPPDLARYLAAQLVEDSGPILTLSSLRVLDPALGEGVLVDSLLEALQIRSNAAVTVTAFDTDLSAIQRASESLSRRYPRVVFDIRHGDFLRELSVSASSKPTLHDSFDLVIANPPYVRTQILGADEARTLSSRFGLEGRIDLYHAFLLGMVSCLQQGRMLGVITSNRFMTTRGAGALRSMLRSRLTLRRVWDLGDTRLFEAAVLPALLVGVRSSAGSKDQPAARFTSIYETAPTHDSTEAHDVVSALENEGVVNLSDGRTFAIAQGTLDMSATPSGVWRLSNVDVDAWLDQVARNTWAPFRAIGKVRVGVKTTADRVFIRDDWATLSGQDQPELLRPIITHHVGRPYRGDKPVRKVLYPHLVSNGVRVVADLKLYPRTERYLDQHRSALEARKYVGKAGRRWYEIWVPQNPASWSRTKLVFRDISERPMFWIDQDGCVVNGDCYWLACDKPNSDDLLWLAAAISNSTFIEQFYDKKFNNKLYSGSRRFITQYVEEFPLPDPESDISREIVRLARERGAREADANHEALEQQINGRVWLAFGFPQPTLPLQWFSGTPGPPLTVP